MKCSRYDATQSKVAGVVSECTRSYRHTLRSALHPSGTKSMSKHCELTKMRLGRKITLLQVPLEVLPSAGTGSQLAQVKNSQCTTGIGCFLPSLPKITASIKI